MTSDEFFTIASLAIAAVSAALSGISSYQQAKTQEKRAKQEGKAALAVGEADKARQQRINLAREATFEAELGAQGSTFQGSPMLAYLENVKQGAIQAEDFNYQGKLQNYYKRMQAGDYAQQAIAGPVKAGIGFGSQLIGASGGSFGGSPVSSGTGAAMGTGVWNPRRYNFGVAYP